MEKKERPQGEKPETVKGECPHCKNTIEVTRDDVTCRVCGTELDESQFWLE